MNKKIIIDGVNVAGCKYLYSRWSNSLPLDNCSLWEETNPDEDNPIYKCKNHPSCYFKQLKRKEQECEELKRTRDDIFLDAIEQRHQVKRYKQALEKIEEIFKNDADGDYDFIKFKIFNIINEVKDK